MALLGCSRRLTVCQVEAGTKWIATRWCREAQPAAQG